ncbi:O-antigen translocase [Vibrio hangzhouensis]|uniref:O-antigen translocase n=1 Tax=Vibrio hangzhouensis TaxID=462991 RepID=UPI001C95CADE|nr:O-antigen translocase [Vibrio hangzhouensis]MBY6198475.1 O-antigen translocase [Vibrio hangzhouensis]
MTLIKTSLLNAISVIIKMLTLLGINKVIAVFVGPVGYAAVGQFQNAVQMVTTFGTGAVNTGVTKYTAEYNGDQTKQKNLWRTSGTLILTCSVLCSLIVFLFSGNLSLYFLKDSEFDVVFKVFSLTIPMLTFNTYFLSILNGKKEIKKYVVANICGSIFSIIVVFALANTFSLKGVLIALATYQSLSFIVTVYVCHSLDWFKLSLFFGRVDKAILKNLFNYTLMALVAAVTSPLSQIMVREIVTKDFGVEYAGYWEAMWRLSSAYLMFATTTLGVYFLPRFSELKLKSEIFNEIYDGYKVIIPSLIVTSIGIYFLRDFVIFLLFTPDFHPMRELFFFQLAGDVLKVGGWLVAFIMLSKAMVKEYIFAQLLFSSSFPLLTLVFNNHFGFQGVAIAHLFNYALYWLIVFILVKKNLLASKEDAELRC